MKNGYMLAIFVLAMTGCEQEVVHRGSSIDRQFGQLNKEGWAVSGMPSGGKVGAASGQDVRVIREADFSGLQFRTNFQVDDPRYPEMSKKNKEDAGAGR